MFDFMFSFIDDPDLFFKVAKCFLFIYLLMLLIIFFLSKVKGPPIPVKSLLLSIIIGILFSPLFAFFEQIKHASFIRAALLAIVLSMGISKIPPFIAIIIHRFLLHTLGIRVRNDLEGELSRLEGRDGKDGQ